jgi:hypothetical protein
MRGDIASHGRHCRTGYRMSCACCRQNSARFWGWPNGWDLWEPRGRVADRVRRLGHRGPMSNPTAIPGIPHVSFPSCVFCTL